MIVFEVETKVIDTETFPQHTIVDLNSGFTIIVLFSQEKPLRLKEINTHTHIYTHTLTHDSSSSKYNNEREDYSGKEEQQSKNVQSERAVK